MDTIHKVVSAIVHGDSQRVARQTAAGFRGLGLDAEASKSSTPGVWLVTITYAEPMTMNEYLTRLAIIEDAVDATTRRLGY